MRLREGRLEQKRHLAVGDDAAQRRPHRAVGAGDGTTGETSRRGRLSASTTGRENPLALHEQIETLLTDDQRQRCVLLVDQFEEIFTQTKE